MAASYIGRSERWLNACGIRDRVAIINEVITRANTLVEKHGVPGIAALSVVTDSLASLRSQALSGIVLIVGTLRTDLGL